MFVASVWQESTIMIFSFCYFFILKNISPIISHFHKIYNITNKVRFLTSNFKLISVLISGKCWFNMQVSSLKLIGFSIKNENANAVGNRYHKQSENDNLNGVSK